LLTFLLLQPKSITKHIMLQKKKKKPRQNCSDGIRTLSVKLQGSWRQRLCDHGYGTMIDRLYKFYMVCINVPDVNWCNSIIKQMMPIFHKMIFKHIFHKRNSLFMSSKGKFICMLKRKFCVASFRFLTIIILFVFVFFPFHLALKALVSAKISVFFLKS
jgi:hypothetical protein